MMLRQISFLAFLFPAWIISGGVVLSVSQLQGAPQLTELSGAISVVDSGGKMVAQMTTADGRMYVITGKLEKMIRDQYDGQTIRLSGKIEQEPAGGKPGVFRVESIAVRLN